MKVGGDPPLPQGVQEHVVWGTALIAMELVEQAMTLVEVIWILIIMQMIHDAINPLPTNYTVPRPLKIALYTPLSLSLSLRACVRACADSCTRNFW